MADIFKEVDEDLRRENLEKLWKKYGKAAIGLALAAVLGVAGVQAWRVYDRQQREAQSDSLAAALALAHGGDPAAAAAALSEMSNPDSGGYGGLAALERARLLAEAGDTDGAVALWDRVAADSALGPAFRSVATLLSVMHQIEQTDPAELRARLTPLAAADQAFRGSALELMAVLALRDGDKASAADLYARISDDRELPTGLRARAAQMLAALKE